MHFPDLNKLLTPEAPPFYPDEVPQVEPQEKPPTQIKIYSPAAAKGVEILTVSFRDDRGFLRRIWDFLRRESSVVKIDLEKSSNPVYAKTSEVAHALGIKNAEVLKQEQEGRLGDLINELIKSTQEKAATKIQKIFRGFKARNEFIQKYVERNFDVQSNVKTINQAKVIYLGELHNVDSHAVRNAWIIDHLYKEANVDRVLIEEIERTDGFYLVNEKSISSQTRAIKKAIEISGWDIKPSELKSALQNYYALDKIADLIEHFKKAGSETEKKAISAKIMARFRSLSDSIKTIPINTEKNMQFYPFLTDRLAEAAIKECPEDYFSFLFAAGSAGAADLILKQLKETFANRQASLTDEVRTQLTKSLPFQFRKVFLIAGRDHLIVGRDRDHIIEKKEKTGDKDKIEKDLELFLKENPHQYAILIPKEGRKPEMISDAEKQKVAKLEAEREKASVGNSMDAINKVAKYHSDLSYDPIIRFASWAKGRVYELNTIDRRKLIVLIEEAEKAKTAKKVA